MSIKAQPMRDPFRNPFEAADTARRSIWTMLVERDIEAFLAADWSMVADDFVGEGFLGIDAERQADPAAWRLSFPTLAAYRDEWLRQAHAFQTERYAEDPRAAIFTTTTLEEIDVAGEAALARKTFDGSLRRIGGHIDVMKWLTFYCCRMHEGRWKISGFTGYLPNPKRG